MKKKSKSNDVVLRANDMKFDNGASYSGAIKDVFDTSPHGFGTYFYPDCFENNAILLMDLEEMEENAICK